MTWKRAMGLMGAAAAGAGLMYMMDPATGRRRMSLARDKMTSFRRKSGRAVRGRMTDLKNRAYGMYCEVRSVFGYPCAPSHSSGTTMDTKDMV